MYTETHRSDARVLLLNQVFMLEAEAIQPQRKGERAPDAQVKRTAKDPSPTNRAGTARGCLIILPS